MENIQFYVDDHRLLTEISLNWTTLVEGKIELEFDERTCNLFYI